MKRRTVLRMVLAPVAMRVTKALAAFSLFASRQPAPQLQIEDRAAARAGELALVSGGGTSDIYVDANDFEVVKIAVRLLADDIQRVSGKRPAIKSDATQLGPSAVIVGTLGRSSLIDQIVSSGQIDSTKIQGGWEAYGIKTITQPLAGVAKALVVAGGDRRGTAYGVMDISRRIGVSPWYWWADVPVQKRRNLVIGAGGAQVSASPSVKYRGLFINDEAWGLLPWATETFDPALNDMGPKTYEKVFELMLRLRLNYLWPSMWSYKGYLKHEFGAVPGNSELADKWAIVMGSSHCEPMLRDNEFWDRAKQGPWNYVTNRAKMLAYWEEWAKARGRYEAVWTLGLRGISDTPMVGPKTAAGQITLLEQVFRDQRKLLRTYAVPARGGSVAQCFTMYNEVLALLDKELKVPPDVTLVWVDDNWGYIRQLPDVSQQKRAGGDGVYCHVDYVGAPMNYCWFSTTPPAKVWEEMRKAWDNHARTIWVLNVGDVKSQEIDTDFWARFAWNVEEFGPESQPIFLKSFAQESFGQATANEVASVLGEYFRLCFIRKPDTMDSAWASGLGAEFADLLMHQYEAVRARAERIAEQVPAEARDAYYEMVLYPVRMLCASGSTFIEYDRYLTSLDDPAKARQHAEAVTRWNQMIRDNTQYFNQRLAEGKWRHMMTVGGSVPQPLIRAYQLPSIDGKAAERKTAPAPTNPVPSGKVLPAAEFSRKSDGPEAMWQVIEGLGWSGRAVALEKMIAVNRWSGPGDLARAPRLEYDLWMDNPASNFDILVHVLPTFRINPSVKLRVAASIGQGPPQFQEVPGSNPGNYNMGDVRKNAILSNRVTLRFSFAANEQNLRTLSVWTPDPGVVLDQIEVRIRE